MTFRDFFSGFSLSSLFTVRTISDSDPEMQPEKVKCVAEEVQPLIAHQAHKAAFEEATKGVEMNQLSLYDYSFNPTTDISYIRVGHDNWMPIPAFLGMVESTNWLKCRLRESLWLDDKSDTVVHWFKVNHRIVQIIQNDNHESNYHRNLDYQSISQLETQAIVPELAGQLSLNNLANLYLSVYGKAHPVHQSNFCRPVCNPLMATIMRSAELSRYKDAEREAIAYVDECVKAFFEANDFELSHDGRMVKIAGYEPLYMVDTKGY